MLAVLLVMGCKDTNENLVQERGVDVAPIMSKPSPAYFTDNIDDSYVQFDLSLPSGETIDKAQIEVVNGDKSAILKDITLPAKAVKVTANDILKALNMPASDYKLGDTFYLYVLTTKNGKTTRSKAAFAIPVICYFAPSMLVGNFYYQSDDWDEDGNVTLVVDPNNPYKVYISDYAQAEGLSGNGNRIELNIDPDNFSVSGPKVVIADDLSEWGLPYHNYAYEPVAGSYSACDDAYTITFAITVSEGSFGNNVFTFTKK